MKYFLSILFLFYSADFLFGQNITTAEYFFDIDPGQGLGTAITITADDTLNFSTNISTTGLSSGFHFLGIRVRYSTGIWSLFEKRNFYISMPSTPTSDISEAEYFIDTDPGDGNGTSIAIGPSGSMVSFTAVVPLSLSEGFHFIAVRVKDQSGKWSLFEKRNFYIAPTPTSMSSIMGAEFAWDLDPGTGLGTSLSIGAAADTIQTTFQIPIDENATLGQHFYLNRVKDADGRWSHFSYDTVTIAINGPADITVNADGGSCSAMVNNLTPLVINSEPYHYILTGATTGSGNGSASGLTFNAGVTTLSYMLDNFPTAFVSSTITIVDAQFPVISCPANITMGSDPNTCGAVVNFNVTCSDNCPGVALSLVSGLTSGSIFPPGVTTNVFRATDSAGNSTTCSFTVSIADDDPPSLACPPNLTVNVGNGLCSVTNVSLGTPTVSDNCGIASTTNNGLTTYPVGTTPVTWTSTDVNGLISTCIQTVTVVDNQNPIITCPANITFNADPGQCSKTATYVATATDNCGIASIVYNPTSSSSFPAGTTTVMVTATDVNGLTSTCNFNVTIKENVPPVISCPNDIYVNTGPAICSAVVSYSVSYSDNCAGVVLTQTAGLPSGSSFPVGITTNSFKATDASGNSVTCQFIVNIIPSGEIPGNGIDDDCDGMIDELPLKAGINTTQPTAMLDVELGDVLFSGPLTLPINPANPPISGAGTRLMWYPDKGAVRAGFVTGNAWNKDSIGNFSIAMGIDAKAIGEKSFSLGNVPRVTGFSSFAIGNYPIVTGDSSLSIGNSNYIYNNKSFAFGSGNLVVSHDAVCMGLGNYLVGDTSFVFGSSSSSYGPAHRAVAMGYNASVQNKNGVAIGTGQALGENGISMMGYSTGKNAVAVRGNAFGENSFSFGGTSKGKYAASIGPFANANGFSSVVVGINSDTLVGPQTSITTTTPLFLVGNGTLNDPNLSNALVIRKDGNVGIGDINPQYRLHISNNQSGNNFARGIMIENISPANVAGEPAISFKTKRLAADKYWMKGINELSPSLAWCYGTSLSASFTRMVLDTSGRLGLSTGNPAFRVQVLNNDNGGGGWSQGVMIQNTATLANVGEAAMSFRNNSLTAGKYLIIGLNQSPNISFDYGSDFDNVVPSMELDTAGKLGINTNNPGFLLELNGTAGKPGGGNWSAPSDARLKNHVLPFADGLTAVLQINPVSYHYNEASGYATDKEYVGVIAQELQTIAPYMVSKQDHTSNKSDSNYLQVDPSAMTYQLINTLKEQQKQIEDLKKKIALVKSLIQAKSASR